MLPSTLNKVLCEDRVADDWISKFIKQDALMIFRFSLLYRGFLKLVLYIKDSEDIGGKKKIFWSRASGSCSRSPKLCGNDYIANSGGFYVPVDRSTPSELGERCF